MRKSIIWAGTLWALTLTPLTAQNVMKVEKTDGSTTEIAIDDIKRITFAEKEAPDTVAIGQPVDLGLSVLWSDRNVGATSELDPGGLYGWGDPTGEKTSNNLDDYPSVIPPEHISDTQYDIARAKWGDGWRLPTAEEARELLNNTEKTYGKTNDGFYVKFTADNGNFIYITYCTYDKYGDEVNHWYWTGDLNKYNTAFAEWFLPQPWMGQGRPYRYKKMPIRPVKDVGNTYEVGDLWPDAAAPEGVVFDVESGGRHGKIVSLDCAYNLAWDPDATLFTPSASCSNTTDGSQNDMPQKESSAGQWYAEKGEGWYCPARGELLTLNRVIDKVNATLTSIGRDRQEGMYWSSTEDLSSGTGMNAFIVCIDHWLQYSGGWYDGVSKDNPHQVCAVKKF